MYLFIHVCKAELDTNGHSNASSGVKICSNLMTIPWIPSIEIGYGPIVSFGKWKFSKRVNVQWYSRIWTTKFELTEFFLHIFICSNNYFEVSSSALMVCRLVPFMIFLFCQISSKTDDSIEMDAVPVQTESTCHSERTDKVCF